MEVIFNVQNTRRSKNTKLFKKTFIGEIFELKFSLSKYVLCFSIET